jgi:hypothetical protein
MASGAVALGAVSVAGQGHSGLAQSVYGATVLIPAFPSGYAQNKYLGQAGVCRLISQQVTASGGGIFQFQGKPNANIIWAITVGSGNITALSSMTDAWGNAWASYQAGGYNGNLTVSVTYHS